MSSEGVSIPHERLIVGYAGKLLSFGDMVDCPKENAVHLDGQSEILWAYHFLGRLTEKIRGGEEVEVVVERRFTDGSTRIVPGRDYNLLVKCSAFNVCTIERYDLLPDMKAWCGLLGRPEFALLASVLIARKPLSRDVADRVQECLVQFREIIISGVHRKRCYNAAGNARRRQRSIVKHIQTCLRLYGHVEFELIDMYWKPEFRMRKALDDTDIAYSRFANGIRHHSVSQPLLTAIFCMELSDTKGFRIAGLLLFERGAVGRAADLGLYWRDQVTAGEGGFLCATGKPFSSMLSKWSGLPIEDLESLTVRQGDHARQQLIEATVTHFASFSQMLRANGAGRKHRQLRIFSSKQSGGRRQAALPVKGWGGTEE